MAAVAPEVSNTRIARPLLAEIMTCRWAAFAEPIAYRCWSLPLLEPAMFPKVQPQPRLNFAPSVWGKVGPAEPRLCACISADIRLTPLRIGVIALLSARIGVLDVRVLADRSECDRFASYAGGGLQRNSVRSRCSVCTSKWRIPHMSASPPRALPGGHWKALPWWTS